MFDLIKRTKKGFADDTGVGVLLIFGEDVREGEELCEGFGCGGELAPSTATGQRKKNECSSKRNKKTQNWKKKNRTKCSKPVVVEVWGSMGNVGNDESIKAHTQAQAGCRR